MGGSTVYRIDSKDTNSTVYRIAGNFRYLSPEPSAEIFVGSNNFTITISLTLHLPTPKCFRVKGRQY